VDVRSHVEALPLPSPSNLTVLFRNYLIDLPMEGEEGELVVAPDADAGRYDQYGPKACGVHAASIAALRVCESNSGTCSAPRRSVPF